MSQHRKVLIAAPVHRILTDWLTANGYECMVQEQITQQQAFDLIRDCSGVITSTRLQLNRELIDSAPMLEWIGRMGSGMEVIDVQYAQAKGINCFSSPEGNANAVAEHALGMLLSLNKRIIKSNNEIKQGQWLRDENRGVELDGKSIGIIGFGHTGRAFAKKLMGFDVQIMVYDKYNQEDYPKYVSKASLEDIWLDADIISFHVPLQEDTYHYVDAAFVDKMRKPFVIINTSRGIVIDTYALWDGLQKKKIRGACIDVWEEEPLSKMSEEMRALLDKIANRPEVVLTPHIAGYSYEAIYKMSKSLLSKIVIHG